MKLLTGNSNKVLSKNIAKYLKSKLVNSSIRKFADGEIYVEINENIRGNSIFIIQSISSPANDNLMELLLCRTSPFSRSLASILWRHSSKCGTPCALWSSRTSLHLRQPLVYPKFSRSSLGWHWMHPRISTFVMSFWRSAAIRFLFSLLFFSFLFARLSTISNRTLGNIYHWSFDVYSSTSWPDPLSFRREEIEACTWRWVCLSCLSKHRQLLPLFRS